MNNSYVTIIKEKRTVRAESSYRYVRMGIPMKLELAYRLTGICMSEVEIAEIIEKYKHGKSTYVLAKEYSCHRYTISKHLKEAGIEVSNRVARKESLVGLILQLYSEWYKPAEIAESLGVSADSVRRCLKENGVELRHSSEYARI